MNTNIQEAGRAAGENVKEMGSHASYEANKNLAKNSNLTAGQRVGAAIDAVGDRVNEASHAGKKEVHKQRAIH